jgi:hypothetical protein
MSLRRRCIALSASLAVGAPLGAQATVIGTVTDSVAHRPLAGALVQLVADSGSVARNATSDSLGAFRFDGVRPGSYIIGFFHPAVDSLGIELVPRRVSVPATGIQRVDLAIPPARSLVAQLCQTSAARDSNGLLLGHIRDAETRQPRSGTVTVLWMELVIGQGGIHRNRQQIPVKSDDLGWFALCGLPSDADLQASAVAGDEESGVVEVRVPAGGLVIRDFLVSHADSTITVYEDSTSATGRIPLATLRRGSARVSGVVHNDKGKPVPNAEVSVPGTGVDSRTQENGTFALGGLPSGTQTVEIRTIGFEPKRVTVDLTRERLTTIDVVLDRPVQMLAAVKVYGKGNASLVEFERRLRAGWGHFLTPTDIAKRNAFQVTDLFRTMPGVRVAPSAGFGNTVLLRGCRPTVYLNGMRMDDNAASEIDMLATPSELTAVEVYTAAARPAQFWGNSCGSVVLWVGMLPR